MASEEEVSAIVIDNGSRMMKAGFAGDDAPRTVFPSIATRQSQFKRGKSLHYPISGGIVCNWDLIEQLWTRVFSKEELNLDPCSLPILITESPLNPTEHSVKAAEIFFEHFKAPALYSACDSLLAVFASGRTTGLVLHSGGGSTQAVPIYEGHHLRHATQRLNVDGDSITDYLMKLLTVERHYSFTTTAEREIVRDVKEKHAFVSQNYRDEVGSCYVWKVQQEKFDQLKTHISSLSRETSLLPRLPAELRDELLRFTCCAPADQKSPGPLDILYELPDGQIITVGAERIKCIEPLFDPSLLYNDGPPIHQLIQNAIGKSDPSLARDFYRNLVLEGGNTMFPGLADRLTTQLKAIAHADVVKVIAPPERKYSTWIGGSIFASLSSFEKRWVTAEEWDEYGAKIIARKCW